MAKKQQTIPKRVINYLEKNEAKYDEVVHKTVYTAYDAAQTLKRELSGVAKNLLIKADKTYALVVVPADKKLDLKKIKKALGAKKISIPDEKVILKVLKIKPGTISSFGKLHKLETLVDRAVTKTKDLVLSTGSTTNSVLMTVKDFINLEEAQLADIATKGDYKVQKPVKKKVTKKPTKKSTKKTTRKRGAAKKKTTKKKATKKNPAKKKVAKKKPATKKRKK